MSNPESSQGHAALAWATQEFKRPNGFSLHLRETAIPSGSLTFLVGRNGSGKSTLLSLLARQRGLRETRVSCEGRPLEEWSSRMFARQTAFLAQDRSGAHPDLTALEVAALGRFPHEPSADDFSIAWEALSSVGAAALAHRPVGELSGGERQKVWIAMALAQQTRILLLDEPVTYLDLKSQLEIIELLHDLRARRGLTILLSIHDLNLALHVPGDWLLLAEGRQVFHGRPEACLRQVDLAGVFGVPLSLLEQSGRRFLITDQPQLQMP